MILILGSTGFLGSRVKLELESRQIYFLETSKSLGLDLTDYLQVQTFFSKNRNVTKIINCAAFVGGISYGYKYPIDLLNQNLLMIMNVYRAAREFGIYYIVNPISNCAFPENVTLFKEDNLWSGPLHISVKSYGFTRRAIEVFSWAYFNESKINSLNLYLPNMYGPGDHFDENRSHALGAFIKKIHIAKNENFNEITLWGTGNPIREWLYIDDGAKIICDFLLDGFTNDEFIIGSGVGLSIKELAILVAKVIEYDGKILFDESNPDGANIKLMDSSKYHSQYGEFSYCKLEEGISVTYDWYKKNG
jgi:GDP-L-fucose synthase